MTMSSQSRTKNYKIYVFVILTGVVFLVVAYGVWGKRGMFASFATTLDVGNQTSRILGTSLVNKTQLESENRALQDKLDKQEMSVVIAQHNAQAYTDLWQEVFSLESSAELAQVLARPPYTAYDQYIIKTPTRVNEHSLVVSAGQYALGYIKEVYNQYALTQLFSAPGEEVVVSIDGVLYTATGRGGGVLEVKLPRSYRESAGSVVELAGSVPYIVGIVSHTEFDPQDSFVHGIISSPLNVYTQELVSVLPTQYEQVAEITEVFNADTQAE